jgi:ribonucleoside-diphosphate reductase alpha chain
MINSRSLPPIAEHVWSTKYRQRGQDGVLEESIDDTWDRVARAIARVEREPKLWEERFREILSGFHFLPGGRILAGAGSAKPVTLFNCFVMGVIEDSLPGVIRALEEGARTMQAGGGVGYDFSTLPPAGESREGAKSNPGPVAYMHVWQSLCAALTANNERRGAMMGTLRCDHPDIEGFIDAKRDPNVLRHFNLSVLVTDAFMHAVRADRDWALRFPVNGSTYRSVSARGLWRHIAQAAYESAEPGLIFVDRLAQENNLAYCETISATNPCGEVPLPAYGACDLGSLNLTQFVLQPFSPRAHWDFDKIQRIVPIAVRFLDNVYDVSSFPLPEQARVACGSRRLGLGITGLADALFMLGLRYESPAARDAAGTLMRSVCECAYQSSIELSQEKGVFPMFAVAAYLRAPFVAALPASLQASIARHGIRNSHLLAIAPAGSISLLAGNVSSGLEPIFCASFVRTLRGKGGRQETIQMEDYACKLHQQQHPGQPLSAGFVALEQISPQAQLEMQAVLQRQVDNAISKTVTMPSDCSFAAYQAVYDQAHVLGLKGCTAFRPGTARGAVLADSHCNGTFEECVT